MQPSWWHIGWQATYIYVQLSVCGTSAIAQSSASGMIMLMEVRRWSTRLRFGISDGSQIYTQFQHCVERHRQGNHPKRVLGRPVPTITPCFEMKNHPNPPCISRGIARLTTAFHLGLWMPYALGFLLATVPFSATRTPNGPGLRHSRLSISSN